MSSPPPYHPMRTVEWLLGPDDTIVGYLTYKGQRVTVNWAQAPAPGPAPGPAPAPAPGPTTPGPGPLSVSAVTITNLTSTTFTGSMTVAGTIPANAVMLLQWTTNPNTGPWNASSTPAAVAGVFSFNFTGAPADAPIFIRGFVYEGSTIYEQTPLLEFRTLASAGTGLTKQMFVDAATAPSEARMYGWINYRNDPANVTFVGGNNSGKEPPAVNADGAILRGTTMPAYWKSDGSVNAAYKDADLWTSVSPLAVVQELTTLASLTSRQHTATNTAFVSRRAFFAGVRRSTGLIVVIRNRSDLQDWFLADEVAQFEAGAIPPQDIQEFSEGGLKLKWNNGAGTSHHFTGPRGGLDGFVTHGNGNRMALDILQGDCDMLLVAQEFKLAPWDPQLPFNPTNAKLGAYVLIDPYPTPTSVTGDTLQVGVCLSHTIELTTSWKWALSCTFRDGMRQDHTHGTPADAGMTRAAFLAAAAIILP